MANTMQSALPRFLLPRLSWTGPVGQQSFAKTTTVIAAAAASSRQRPWQPVTIRTQRNYHHMSTVSSSRLPKSIRLLQQQQQQPAGLRRAFHATAPRPRDHHFDTLKFVQRLQSEGFTEEQSVAMMKVLNDVIQER